MEGRQMRLKEAIETGTAQVAVIGLGYVGLPLAVAAARGDFSVTGFDVDPSKIEKIEAGRSYIDAVSDAALVESGMTATRDFTRLSDCQVIVICVPTPDGVVNPLVMGLLFYLTVTPTGLLMRLFGKDPLRLRFDPEAKSYWIERQPPGPAPETMRHQF